MSLACMHALAKRHGLNPDHLVEAWTERAAIREYMAGFQRATAELFAVGDVEQMYQIGLHCPVNIARWTGPVDPSRARRKGG